MSRRETIRFPAAIRVVPGLVAALIALTQTEAAGSAALTAVTGSVEATQVPLAEDLRGQTYVALGDSISVGYDAPGVGQIFPAAIARAPGMNLTLVARSGAKAAGGAGPVPDALGGA